MKILLSVLTLGALVQAAPLGLKTKTELGFIKNTGNTVNETMSSDISIDKNWEKHIASLKFTNQYGTQDGVETKNKWLTELNYGYKFTEILAFDYIFGYKADKFSSFEYQLYTGPGAKYTALQTKTQNLNLSANILYAQDKNNDTYEDSSGVAVSYPYPAGSTKVSTGETKDYTGYRIALNYDWQVLENLKFLQELNYRNEFKETKNYFIYSKSALSTKLSDYLSAGVSYIIDYVNVPGVGKKDTDNTFTANLIINY